MAWTLDDAAVVSSDLDGIFDHLLNSYLRFGDPFERAFIRASDRVASIFDQRNRIAKAPHIGTRHLVRDREYRHVTIERAVYWFRLDEATETVRVLGIFHGGQEHLGRMMARLTAEGDG